MTPQQKRAWYGLAIGVVWSLAILAVFIIKGATAYNEDAGMRALLYVLFIAGLLAYLAMSYLTGWKMRKMGVITDERDMMILSKVPRYQMFAVLITLGVWVGALSEIYWDQGQIPVVFPYLIFYSVIIVNIVFKSAGALIAYWRMR